MKKIITTALVFGLILLSACSLGGNNGETPKAPEKTKIFSTEYVELSYPADWEVVEKKDFPSGTFVSTVVIFKSDVKNELFITNVNIAHNALPQAILSTDYGKQVIANQKAILQNYKEINREEIDVSISGKIEKAIVVAFEGKRMATDPVIRFIQMYAVKENQAYIATAAMLPTEEKSIQLSAEDIVRSLKIK